MGSKRVVQEEWGVRRGCRGRGRGSEGVEGKDQASKGVVEGSKVEIRNRVRGSKEVSEGRGCGESDRDSK